jgi:hypothetical protein
MGIDNNVRSKHWKPGRSKLQLWHWISDFVLYGLQKKIPNTMQENNVRLKQIPVALETILAKETNLCLTEIIYRWKHECSALSCFSCTFSFFDDH